MVCSMGIPYLLNMTLCVCICQQKGKHWKKSSRGKYWDKMTEYSCVWMALKWCFESRKTLSSLFLFASSLSSDAEGTRWHWVSACVFHVSCFDSHAHYHKHCEHVSLYKFSRCLCLTDKRIMHIQQIFESYVMKLYK